MDVQHTVVEIDDPVFRHSAAGIDARLPPEVGAQCRVRDLDQQQEVSWRWSRCGVEVRARDEQRNVRLRLVVSFDADRILDRDQHLVIGVAPIEQAVEPFDAGSLRRL